MYVQCSMFINSLFIPKLKLSVLEKHPFLIRGKEITIMWLKRNYSQGTVLQKMYISAEKKIFIQKFETTS